MFDSPKPSALEGDAGDQPRRPDPASTDPHAIYRATYGSISSAPARPRHRSLARQVRIRRILFLAVALAVGLLALWPRPDPTLRPGDEVGARDETSPERSAPAAALGGPRWQKVAVRVGEERQFLAPGPTVATNDPALRYRWAIDGREAGTDDRLLVYTPAPADVGRRRVELIVEGRGGEERRGWIVKVRPARPPRLLVVEPVQPSIELASGDRVRLRVEAEPGSPVDRLHTTWSVDGAVAGEGDDFTFRAEHPGSAIIRARVQSDLGTGLRLEWRVRVLPPAGAPQAAVRPAPEKQMVRTPDEARFARPAASVRPGRRGAWTGSPRSGVDLGPMAGTGAFVDDLRATIDASRAFGRHPLWLRIAAGELPRSGLGPFVVQFFLQVREFPRAVSALHSSCPDGQERIELAESLYEEETGRISGCNVSHPELFIRFGEGVGVPRDAMMDGVPLPTTAALIAWFEQSTREHPFIEGAAATNLAAEGQVPGAFGPFARALEQHYGCTRAQVAFWDVHEQADREHSAIGDHVVIRMATTPELQAGVRRAVARSLELWWAFFDGIAGAIDAR